MGIRIKTLLIVSISFGVVFTGIFVLARFFFLAEYEKLDTQTFAENASRINELLHGQADNLLGVVKDYSYWDDSYTFVQDKNQEFINSSLSLNTYQTNTANYLRYQDLAGNAVYEHYVNLKTGAEEIPPAELEQFVKTYTMKGEASGYVVLGNSSYLIAMSPVRDSKIEKAPNGYLIFARKLDADFISQISKTTKVVPRIDTQPEPGYEQMKVINADGVLVYQQILPDQMIAHFKAPTDISINPPFVDFSYQRTFYIQGVKSMNQFAWILMGTFIIMDLSIFLTLERFVNQPITKLSDAVNRVATSHGTQTEIVVEGTGEIESLEHNINTMLHQIEELNVHEKAIIDAMGEGLLAIDGEGNLTIVNPTAEKLLGVKAEEVLGKPWIDVVTSMIGDSVTPMDERTFLKAKATGKVIVTTLEANHYYRVMNGRTFPVTSITAPLKHGSTIVGAVKVFRNAIREKEERAFIEQEVKDRTIELKQKNDALQHAQDDISRSTYQIIEEKARLTASIVSLSVGFCLLDTSGKVIVLNPALKKMLNLSTEIAQFGEIQSLFGPTFNLEALLKQCQDTLQPVEQTDITFEDKYFKIFFAPIITSAGEKKTSIGTVFLLEDMTEAKVVERSKEEFFSIASHELRTPLTAIRGNTSMILDMYGDKIEDESMKEMLTDIHSSSIRLIEIVNDFLNISRLEQQRMEFKKMPFDIHTIVKEVVSELQSIQNGYDVKLVFEPGSTPLPAVIADPDKTKEVIVNFVGNALKFTQKGEVKVFCSQEGDYVRCRVSDTGRGIAPQNRTLLFRKFQQAGANLFTRDTTKGTGLGLYISKLMVEGMGGAIGLERSTEGEGSVFFFTLPLAK